MSESAKELITHMMNPNPSARYTIDQCLNHPWLKTEQSDADLGGVANELRRFQAKKKMRVRLSSLRIRCTAEY